MYYSIDRFEEDKAVLIDESAAQLILPREQLPPQAAPGCIVAQNGDGVWIIDEARTAQSREKIRRKLASLWE